MWYHSWPTDIWSTLNFADMIFGRHNPICRVTPATPAPLGVGQQLPTAAGSALGVGAAASYDRWQRAVDRGVEQCAYEPARGVAGGIMGLWAAAAAPPQ